MLILVINPGATSTKIAVFDGETELFKKSIDHDAGELAAFGKIIDQFDYRLQIVMAALAEADFDPCSFAAVCGRGGLLRHIPSGTYSVTDKVLEDVKNPPYGEHASNLGVMLAKSIADMGAIPAYFVDPVSVDELAEVARISGFAGMERQSFFHALNQKAMARKAALIIGRHYEELNLIVIHMGGGVSVAAHKAGRVVDVNNVKDEGAFAMDRGGSLPVNAIINFCFDGKTKQEAKTILGTQAGLFSYLGTRDLREVEKRIDLGDESAKLIYDAMCYQLGKDIGAMAAVLHFDVDGIVLTGGMAYSDRMCADLADMVGKLGRVIRLPGENEMESLALGALRVLRGEQCLKY